MVKEIKKLSEFETELYRQTYEIIHLACWNLRSSAGFLDRIRQEIEDALHNHKTADLVLNDNVLERISDLAQVIYKCQLRLVRIEDKKRTIAELKKPSKRHGILPSK